MTTFRRMTISDLPIEVYWGILECLDFESSMRFANSVNISPLDAYRYHMFKMRSDMQNIFLIFNELHAIIQDDEDVLKALLLNKRFRKVFDDQIIFIFVCRNGYKEFVKCMLKWNTVDPSFNNNMAFRMACENGHSETVKNLLVDCRIDPAANNNQAIRFAAIYGDSVIFHLLINDSRVTHSPNYPTPPVKKL